ncbi:PhoX family protein [soil metagenome]
MRRRSFLRLGAGTATALAFGPDFWRAAYAEPAHTGSGPYGVLGERAPDGNGIVLPEGFRSRELARGGQPVRGTDHTWHVFPDGGATFPVDDEGGWIYVSNSEQPSAGAGGAGMLRFDADGEVVDARPILDGTTTNCAGGPTPWGTWLSCEEFEGGRVWECDPTGERPAEVRPALGTFVHEAVAVDPAGERLYLTEDRPDGRLYRFTPEAYPDLDAGVLEVAAVDASGAVRWLTVPDPTGRSVPTRAQVPASTAFNGGEGIWFDSGVAYFTTKGDDRVRSLTVADDRIDLVYDPTLIPEPPLRGVDNVTVAPSGDLYVCEDGGDMELVLITPEREVTQFLRVLGQDGSELTGCAFDPSGKRLYLSSQRGGGGPGITYEVTGPFRQPDPPPAPSTSLAAVGSGDDGGSDLALPLGLGGAAVVAAVGGAVAWRRRGNQAATPDEDDGERAGPVG